MIDLRAHNFMHVKISLHARCVHTRHCVHNLLSPVNEAVLIFVSPYFQFCLHAETVMAAHFSFVIEGIKETLEWFQ